MLMKMTSKSGAAIAAAAATLFLAGATMSTVTQAAVPRFRSRPAHAALRRNPQRKSADRLVRGHQRKLHDPGRPAAPHARPDLRALSRGDARGVVVDRHHRAA